MFLNERFDFNDFLAFLKSLLVHLQLFLVQVHPFEGILQNLLGQFSFHYTVLNGDDSFIVSVSHMEVGRIMVVAKHLDDNSEEAA